MKQIKGKHDLAINGAEPAFSQPAYVGRPNLGDREKFHNYVDQIFDSNWLTNNGPLVQEFEQRIAKHHNVKHCIAMCNGTISLEIAIRALSLKGEVIIPSYTFIATAHALSWQGITPVFADIDPISHTLDPESVRKLITPKTSAIIGVHLWGRAAHIGQLQEIADENGLSLMFDAAHAFSCSYKGTKIGGFGECEILSFHATKVLNSFEGGAVLTNNDELAASIKLMRNFGFENADNVIHPGTNGKMTEISAAMGLVNLDSIDDVIEINKRNYDHYLAGLASLADIRILPYDENQSNNYQYIVMEIEEGSMLIRDELINTLNAENIWARRYFWPGCHKMAPYKTLYPEAESDLPQTQKVAENVIVLPTGESMTKERIGIVIDIIKVLYHNN
ncbi:MAG: dTDP-4-dehydro-6-deoxyglucose aminotransferase [Gammaproteobacteria bacterium]|nr:MAG: dTDP-4-dehydro-6-deoxyglucose aminotransferase [Gammaproteobacteria bacterium]